jgi:hypothetical protein
MYEEKKTACIVIYQYHATFFLERGGGEWSQVTRKSFFLSLNFQQVSVIIFERYHSALLRPGLHTCRQQRVISLTSIKTGKKGRIKSPVGAAVPDFGEEKIINSIAISC